MIAAIALVIAAIVVHYAVRAFNAAEDAQRATALEDMVLDAEWERFQVEHKEDL